MVLQSVHPQHLPLYVNQMVLLSPFFQKVCPHNFVASVMEEGDGEEGGERVLIILVSVLRVAVLFLLSLLLVIACLFLLNDFAFSL